MLAAFYELSELVAAGPPDITQGGLGPKHCLEFGDPPWLADIMSSYNLTPRPS